MAQKSVDIFSVTVQAIVFSLVSTAVSDCIRTWHQQTFNLTPIPYLKFGLIAMTVTPPNFVYQAWLEDTFPTHRTGSSQESTSENTQTRFSKRSAVMKFIMDQSLGAAVNTVAFIVLASAWQGHNFDQICIIVQREFYPMLCAGWKFWPLVTLLNLCVVPWDYRPVVGNTAGLCWGTYVALANV